MASSTEIKKLDHLIAALRDQYEVTQDCMGGLYCGITLKWDHTTRLLEISIPGYMEDVLQKFQHPIPTTPYTFPRQYTSPNYGSTALQLVHPTDYLPSLNPEEANNVHQAVGKIMYYSHKVDLAMLVALKSKADYQAKLNQATAKNMV